MGPVGLGLIDKVVEQMLANPRDQSLMKMAFSRVDLSYIKS